MDHVCRSLRRVKVRSDIKLAYRVGESEAVVEAFADLTRKTFRVGRRSVGGEGAS